MNFWGKYPKYRTTCIPFFRTLGRMCGHQYSEIRKVVEQKSFLIIKSEFSFSWRLGPSCFFYIKNIELDVAQMTNSQTGYKIYNLGATSSSMFSFLISLIVYFSFWWSYQIAKCHKQKGLIIRFLIVSCLCWIGKVVGYVSWSWCWFLENVELKPVFCSHYFHVQETAGVFVVHLMCEINRLISSIHDYY
jgi:hypothetical protein